MCKDVHCNSKSFVTYQSKPSAAVHNVTDNAVKPDLICDPCARAIATCQVCKYINSNLSLVEIQHLQLMRENMSLIRHENGNFQIQVSYPQLKDPMKVFHPKNARVEQVKAASLRLRNKLSKLGLLDHYHKLIMQALQDDHLELVDPKDLLAHPVNYLPLNYVLKDSISTPVRPTTNGSYNNRVGVSLNSNSVTGPTILGNGVQAILGFRSHDIGFNSDVSKFYRCILTCPITNQLRRIFWFTDPSDPKSIVPMQFTRGQFGDASISCFSELAFLDFIAPECQTEELRMAVSEHRLVDDITSSCGSMEILHEIKCDMETTFSKFGFSIKHFLYSNMELAPDQSPIEKVLGLNWSVSDDSLTTNVTFNVHEKKRGKYSGDALTLEQCSLVPITKTVLARLSGQGFGYCGILICPVQSSLRIFFSQICTLIQDWHLPLHVVDENLDSKVRTLLRNLVDFKQQIQPIPRCFALRSTIRRLYVCSDASQNCLGFSIYVLSVDSAGAPQCHLILARSAIHHMTIPHGEMTALSKAVRGLNEILTMSKHLAETPDLQIIFCIDSLCGAHSLAPTKLHTDVRVRNCCHSVHRILSDIVHSHANISVAMVHCQSDNNPADIISRCSLNPSVEINGSKYRHGPDVFKDVHFPRRERIFLSFDHKDGAQYSYPLAEQECSSQDGDVISSSIVNCSKCNFTFDFCYSLPEDWQQPEHSGTARVYSSFQCDVSVPVLDQDIYNNLLKRVRSLSKVLNVLYLILRNFSRVFSSLSAKDLKHLCFLILVKTSQCHYPASGRKLAQAFSDAHGVLRALTRLDAESAGILGVDDSPVIVSPTDRLLTKLLIRNAHLAPSSMLTSQHLGPVLTDARLLSQPFPVFLPNSLKAVRAYIDKCAICKYITNQPYQARFSAPRWAKIVRSQDLIFSNISIDSVGPLQKLGYPKSKKVVKYWILVIVCNFSRAITFRVMEDNTRASVTLALFAHSCTYRKPDRIFADAGTSQVPRVGSPEYVQYFGSHEMECCQYESSHQKLNLAERFIQEMKKLLRTIFLQRDSVKVPHLEHSKISGILGAVQDVMNTRPIFGHGTYVTANHLIKPYILDVANESRIEAFQVSLDLLRDSIGSAHRHFVSILKSSFTFDKSRMMQHKKFYDLQLNDIVLFFRTDKYCLAKIVDYGPHYCKIILPGCVPHQTKTVHNSKLVLVHREISSETENDEKTSSSQNSHVQFVQETQNTMFNFMYIVGPN